MRRLIAAGWEVASHSATHPDLRKIDDAALRQEVAGSRATLQKLLHVPVEFFCYPAGRLDDRVVAAVRAAGYSGATTTALGPRAARRHVQARRASGSIAATGWPGSSRSCGRSGLSLPA